MNILVFKADGTYYTRPDTTLERDCEDFYIPDDVESVVVRRCLCTRITRAGKAIRDKFALKYFDSFCTGLLIYGILSDSKELTPFIDSSSYITDTMKPVTESDAESLRKIKDALVRITRHTSIRTGDYLCVECGEESRKMVSGDSFEGILLH